MIGIAPLAMMAAAAAGADRAAALTEVRLGERRRPSLSVIWTAGDTLHDAYAAHVLAYWRHIELAAAEERRREREARALEVARPFLEAAAERRRRRQDRNRRIAARGA